MVNFKPWRKETRPAEGSNDASTPAANEKQAGGPRKWNLGILSDPETDEVPGKKDEVTIVYRLNMPQAPSSSSPARTTATSRSASNTPTHAHPPRRCPQSTAPALAAHPEAPARHQIRSARKMAASFSTRSLRTRRMTRSTGGSCDATSPSCRSASTAWSAVA